MEGEERKVLGCLVRDAQTGLSVGWVRTIMYNPAGTRVTELLVDPVAKARERSAGESGERIVGHPLYDPSGRHLGEVVDVVVGAASGKLQGLLVDRGASEPDFLPTYEGLVHEDGRWTLIAEAPKLRTTMYAPVDIDPGPPDASEDWMVGQNAARKLVDREGKLIVDRGQRITSATVEHASRAGMLHLLDAEPASARLKRG